MATWSYTKGPMTATFESEAFACESAVRQRVTKVYVEHLYLPAHATARQTGANAPMPLSQYLSETHVAQRITHTDRGHLIGLQFGGPEHPFNLVPMYAGFNGQSGAWGTFERTIAGYLATKGRAVNLLVTLSYGTTADALPQVPTVIAATVHADGPLPASLQGMRILLHRAPTVDTHLLTDEDQALRTLLEERTAQMIAAGWLVEDVVESPGRDSKLRVGPRALSRQDFGFGTDALGTQAYYATRPYAVLDYLRYRHKAEYAELGFPAAEVGNVTKFSAQQVEAVRRVNLVRNGGVLRTDLPGVDPFLDLMMASTDAKAAVDHVWPKQKGGANVFSNARLISQKLNTTFNDHDVLAAVDRRYLPLRA